VLVLVPLGTAELSPSHMQFERAVDELRASDA